MTTFGGHTIPPLFGGGGGGFLQGNIRIGSVGPDYIGPLGGNPAPVILPPASANVGDELWQVVHSSGTYANPAGWGQRIGGGIALFNRFRVFSRIATGTVADDFILPANTLMISAKQWTLQEFFPADTFPSVLFQSGLVNNFSTLAWNVGNPPGTALSLNVANDPGAYVLGFFACQDRQQPATVTPVILNSNPSGMETICSIASFMPTGGVSVDTQLTLITFQYLPASVAYPAYTIGRVPGAPNTYAQFTQYQRRRLT